MLATHTINLDDTALELTHIATLPETLQPVYMHDVWTQHEEIAPQLEAAGYVYDVFTVNGRPVAGWIKSHDALTLPTPDPVVVRVRSDSDADKVYRVKLTPHLDEIHSCTCYAGQKGTPCKHQYRAMVVADGSFTDARDRLLALGRYEDEDRFNAHFRALKRQTCANAAIALIIEEAFGPHHWHANLPAKPVTPRKKLAKWRALREVNKSLLETAA